MCQKIFDNNGTIDPVNVCLFQGSVFKPTYNSFSCEIFWGELNGQSNFLELKYNTFNPIQRAYNFRIYLMKMSLKGSPKLIGQLMTKVIMENLGNGNV